VFSAAVNRSAKGGLMNRKYDLAMSRDEFDALFREALLSVERWKLGAVIEHLRDTVGEITKPSRSRRRRKNRKPSARDERRELSRIRRERRKAEYQEYMRSDEWAELRLNILNRDNHSCLCCGKIAWQVHHRSYADNVMAGNDWSKLASMCGRCHRRIHFEESGERVKKSDVEKRLVSLMTQRGIRNDLQIHSPSQTNGRPTNDSSGQMETA